MVNIAELVKNKEYYIAQKKSKEATHKLCSLTYRSDDAEKAEGEATDFDFVAVINTTNWMDSHRDVHAKGIWEEDSLNGLSYIIDHNFGVSGLIAKPADVKASVRRMRWKQLGLDLNGTTDALIFEVKLKDYANPDFIRLRNGGVELQNSIRMSYDEVVLCVNDKEYGAEFEAWNKYIKEVVNFEEAEKVGYFWYVKKAKARLEGSAVLRGSNGITPILEKQENAGVDTQESNNKEVAVKAPVWLNLM